MHLAFELLVLVLLACGAQEGHGAAAVSDSTSFSGPDPGMRVTVTSSGISALLNFAVGVLNREIAGHVIDLPDIHTDEHVPGK